MASGPTMRPMGVPLRRRSQNIETNVPSGSTHGDEAVTDVGPQRQARAATQVFEFPPHIEPPHVYSSTSERQLASRLFQVTCGAGAPTV